jgi:hypothetical protein
MISEMFLAPFLCSDKPKQQSITNYVKDFKCVEYMLLASESIQ